MIESVNHLAADGLLAVPRTGDTLRASRLGQWQEIAAAADILGVGTPPAGVQCQCSWCIHTATTYLARLVGDHFRP